MEILRTILGELWYMLLIVILAFAIMEFIINLVSDIITQIYSINLQKENKKRIQELLDSIEDKEK